MHDGIVYSVEEAPGLHPKLRELLALWRAKRGARATPTRADINTIELRPWLGNLMLLEVIDNGADMLYRVYGSALADYFGRDLTGRKLSSLPPQVSAVVSSEYRQAIVDPKPLTVTHRRSVQHARIPISKLILPLGAPAAIQHLLVGVYLS